MRSSVLHVVDHEPFQHNNSRPHNSENSYLPVIATVIYMRGLDTP